MYDLVVHDVGVLRAFNPMHIIDYFRRNGKEGWISLGGVILCVTGKLFNKSAVAKII
jgi:KUP system potassium uptake protein